ncbi:MAG TPA: hypothetical protein VN452_04570 [Longilinea sp.]|nr:hypothetical protein [Longilinea sp.]
MAKKLKCVIFGINDVIVKQGEQVPTLYSEIGRLMKFLQFKGITPVYFGNHDWTYTDDSGKKRRFQEVVNEEWGQFPWFIPFNDGTPIKGKKEASEHILNRLGIDRAEAVYIGNSEKDMQTAVNGGLLFLNVTWYSRNTEYGFFFDSVLDIAKFIDTFCLRDSLWHYSIEVPDLRYYALAPYSTMIPEFAYLSSDARAAAKFGMGHVDFWTKYLFSTIYFSELFKEINYIAVVPSSKAGSGNTIMTDPMSTFAKCFRQKFLSDLIIRHSTISPSHNAYKTGVVLNHKRQLDSIMLNEYPVNRPGVPYVKCPITSEKTVLLMDDICTHGYNMEAARLYIEQTGAKVICMSWLKTIKRGYEQIKQRYQFNPFQKTEFPEVTGIDIHPYRNFIVDDYAPEELTQKLKAYDNWTWPAGI